MNVCVQLRQLATDFNYLSKDFYNISLYFAIETGCTSYSRYSCWRSCQLLLHCHHFCCYCCRCTDPVSSVQPHRYCSCCCYCFVLYCQPPLAAPSLPFYIMRNFSMLRLYLCSISSLFSIRRRSFITAYVSYILFYNFSLINCLVSRVQ